MTTSNSASHPVPRWPPAWEGDLVIRTLKEKYEEDPAGFYLITDRFFLEWSQTAQRNGFTGYTDWIGAKFGESQCFSGVFHAFPNATLTQCIQAVMAIPRSTRDCIGYSKWQMSIPNIRTNGRPCRKKIVITERQDAAQLQHSLTEGQGTTHTCNWTYCINPLHLVSETVGDNRRRNMCFRHAK